MSIYLFTASNRRLTFAVFCVDTSYSKSVWRSE